MKNKGTQEFWQEFLKEDSYKKAQDKIKMFK